jgi:hypothetical protein
VKGQTGRLPKEIDSDHLLSNDWNRIDFGKFFGLICFVRSIELYVSFNSCYLEVILVVYSARSRGVKTEGNMGFNPGPLFRVVNVKMAKYPSKH